MSHPTKIALGLLGLALVAALALWVESDRADRFSPNSRGPLQTESERSQRLEVAAQEVSQRLKVKSDLLVELIEGRRGLAEVAKRYLALHENDRLFREYHPIHYPGQTPLERMARDVVSRAYQRVEDTPQRERVVRRLSEEFRTLFPEAEPLQFEPVLPP